MAQAAPVDTGGGRAISALNQIYFLPAPRRRTEDWM